MELIKLKNIYYEYPGEIKVFELLNFSLKKGQRAGIIGSNGSGKTTLFSLIMGLAYPQKGDVVLFEKQCSQEKDFVLARKKIGYLFQDPDDQVFCPTVEEDIAFGPLNLGVKLDDVKKLTEELVKELGIESLLKRITTKLSWGQKRLVSLAGVLAMNPDVLILDEPTASIDDNVIKKITEYFKKNDYSLLIASHDKKFLKNLCTDNFYLKNGNLYQIH
ncbi:MAG: energy-coupling factor ABC transporter ATP-binding protein [Candidatus Omnitrophica bacterium]|nr:energy-coupling factor ABC transporter ATP-binding protein [Candidatus Omnitrophota bacterium]